MRTKFFKQITSIEYWPFLLLLAFFLLRMPDFISNAFVPDEVWHTLHMRDIKDISYWVIDNYQGHGVAFWYFGALMEHFFGDFATFFILRIFSLLSLIGTAYFMVLSWKASFEKHLQSIFFLTLFILTLPLFWWDGKLIFPEFFQCFLIALAYYLIYVKKPLGAVGRSILAFFLLGFCLGLKFHAGAAIAFFVADNFFENFSVSKFKWFILNMLALTAGFFISNPIILTHTAVFVSNINENGAYFDGSWSTMLHHWGDILTGRYPEWDLVCFGGMNRTSMPLINLFFLVVMIVIASRQKRLFCWSVLIFFLSAIVMLTINMRFLSHYLFTMLILIILLASKIHLSESKIKNLNACFFVAILVNFSIMIPNILQDREMFQQMRENLTHADEHTQCIISTIQNKKFAAIIDNTDVGANADRENFLIKSQLNVSNNIPIINEASGIDLLDRIPPEMRLAFLRGDVQFIYLDGKRTRNIHRYAEFIPELSGVVSSKIINGLFLKDCFGTRVSLISIQQKDKQS